MTDAADANRRTASRRVAEAVRALIDDGTYPPGSRLPSYRELAATYDVALNTAREAIRHLADERRVRVRHGVGVDVRHEGDAEPTADHLRELRVELESLRRQLAESGAAIRVIEQRISEIVDELGGVEL